MEKYINEDDFRHTMYHEVFETDTEMQRWDSGCWIRYKLFENVLENQPPADVVPVRHGKWIRKGDEIYCSDCMFRFYPVMFNYCPNCGADMRGDIK